MLRPKHADNCCRPTTVAVFRDTGGMVVRWPTLDSQPAGAPVTVEEIQALAAEIDQAVRDTTTALRTHPNADAVRDLSGPARLATDDAVLALAVAIARAERKHERRWWDPRRWWR